MYNYFVSYTFKGDTYSEVIKLDFIIKNTEDFENLKLKMAGKSFVDSVTILSFYLL